MTSMTPSAGPAVLNTLNTVPAGSVDDWQRRFGVPWDRVDRAARAVLDRAAAASKRKFADLNASTSGVERSPAGPDLPEALVGRARLENPDALPTCRFRVAAPK